VKEPDERLGHHLSLSERLLSQKRHSKNKVYSIHAPEGEWISKGKTYKRYEFGVKTGVTSTWSASWALGIRTFPGNPYDGHTLTESLKHTERLIGERIDEAYVDLGYRGHGHEGHTQVHPAWAGWPEDEETDPPCSEPLQTSGCHRTDHRPFEERQRNVKELAEGRRRRHAQRPSLRLWLQYEEAYPLPFCADSEMA